MCARAKSVSVLIALLAFATATASTGVVTVAGSGVVDTARPSGPGVTVVVPSPPVPMAVAAGSPAEQASAVVAAIAAAPAGETAAWLAAYDLAAVPVFDEQGVTLGTTADDPVGAPYWQVWTAAGLTAPQAGVRLSDLVASFADEPAGATDAGTTVLDALRAARGDPAATPVAFLAEFIEARARQAGRAVEVLASTTTADQVVLDTATAQLLSWVILRTMVAAVAIDTESGPSTTSVSGPSGFARALVPAPFAPCSELWGDETTTGWVNWFTRRIGSGIRLAGVGVLQGLVERMSDLAPHIFSSTAAARFTAIAGKVNLATGLLGLLMQFNSITLDDSVDPTPLVRSKTTNPGATSTHTLTVRFDNRVADGNDRATCALRWLASAAGLSISLPADGPIAGAEVVIQPGLGFAAAGDYVTIDSSGTNALKWTTDDNGEVTVRVSGRGQPTDRSTSNFEWNREYSMHILSQPGEVGGTNIANIFLDGLTIEAAGAAGVAGTLIDLSQTLHWDLGEQIYPLTDWLAGFSIDVTRGGVLRFTGTVCDPTQPFHMHMEALNVAAPISGDFTIAPDGAWTFVGVGPDIPRYGPVTVAGSGSSTLTADAVAGSLEMTVHDWTASHPVIGTIASPLDMLDLTAISMVPITDTCPGNS